MIADHPFYQDADGSSAALIVDDAAMTTDGVHIVVPATAQQSMTFYCSYSYGPYKNLEVRDTYPPGTDYIFDFVASLSITPVAGGLGGKGFQIQGMTNYGCERA